MVPPKKVSRKEFARFSGARWNAMNDILALSSIDQLTDVQRTAHLAYWYMSEVYNGGHGQYFCNQSHLDHTEVARSLKEIGAIEQSAILLQAIQAGGAHESDQFDEVAADSAFNSCSRSIEACLEGYLDKHETEFVEWIP